jgi:hypothetical protein
MSRGGASWLGYAVSALARLREAEPVDEVWARIGHLARSGGEPNAHQNDAQARRRHRRKRDRCLRPRPASSRRRHSSASHREDHHLPAQGRCHQGRETQGIFRQGAWHGAWYPVYVALEYVSSRGQVIGTTTVETVKLLPPLRRPRLRRKINRCLPVGRQARAGWRAERQALPILPARRSGYGSSSGSTGAAPTSRATTSGSSATLSVVLPTTSPRSTSPP